MKIVFADSFFKSLRRMRRREMFHWRVWNFIRYELLRGLKNFWFFRKQIWSFRPWDYTYQLDLLKRSLEPLGDCIEKGMEIDETRLKKVDAIRRSISILENITKDRYIDLAEKAKETEVNVEYMFEEEPEDISRKNRDIFDLAQKMEEEEWIELFRLLRGQDHEDYKSLMEKIKCKEETKEHLDEWELQNDHWNKWFDGSGMKGWWD